MTSSQVFSFLSYKLSKFFVYAALVTPLLVFSSMFFPFVAGKAIYFRVVVALALLFFVFYALGSRERVFAMARTIATRPLFIAVSAFVAVYLITALTGVNFHLSFFSNFERGDGAFQLLHVYAFFFLLLMLFPSEKDWRRLLAFSVGVSVLIAVYAILQKFQAYEAVQPWLERLKVIGDGGRPPGTLGNPSYLSVYAMFHMLFALFLIYRSKVRMAQVALGAAMVLNFYVLLNAQTRGTIIGFGVAALLALVILSIARPPSSVSPRDKLPPSKGGAQGDSSSHTKYKNTRYNLFRDPRWISRALLIGLVVFTLFFVNTRTSLDVWTKVPGINRFAVEELFSPLQDDSMRSRYLTWTSAYAGFLERPVRGWGAENFPVVFDRHYHPLRFGTESWFDRAHNFVLDYLVAGGIPLLGAYLAMFYLYYREMIFMARPRQREDGEPDIPPAKQPYFLYVGLLILPVAYLVQNLFLFDVLPIYIVLFTLFAFSTHLSYRFSLSESASSSPSPAGKAPSNDREGARERRNHKPSSPPANFPVYSTPSVVMCALCAVLAVVSLYATAYLPWQKNLSLRQALAITQQNPVEGMAAFERTLETYSPVGQSETVEQMASNLANFFGQLLSNQQMLRSEVAPLTIDHVNEVYEYARDNGHLVSVKPLFLYGMANLQAAPLFRDASYTARAREIFEEGHRISPTRFEFIFGLMDIGVHQRDRALLTEMLEKARKHRPDLEPRYERYQNHLNSF